MAWPDVLVQAKQVGGVVTLLDRGEASVGGLAVRLARDLGADVRLFVDVVSGE